MRKVIFFFSLLVLQLIIIITYAELEGDEDLTFWNKTYDQALGTDEAGDIAFDSQDNLYVVGAWSVGSIDWNIKRFNKTGQENVTSWNKTFDGLNEGKASGVAIDSNDNVYVVGYTNAGAAFQNLWNIHKFYSNGSEEATLWNLTYNLTPAVIAATTVPYAVAIDSNNNVYVVGSAQNLMNGTSGNDWHIKRFNSSGAENTTHWNKTFNNWIAPEFSLGGNDIAEDVGIDSQDSVYVVGRAQATNNGDWWIKKFYFNGSEEVTEWNKTYDASAVVGVDSVDSATGIAIDSQDRIYVAGYGNSLLGTTEEFWVLKKYNRSGSDLGTVFLNITGFGNARALDVGVDREGNVYVVGFAANSSNATSNDDWMIKKFNSSGIELIPEWNLTFTGPFANGIGASDRAVAVDVDSSGNVTIVGYGTNITASNSGRDWWIKKFQGLDITPPRVTLSNPATTGANGTTGFQAFNITVLDSNLMQNVLFQFSNGSTAFNRSATNVSGNWNYNENLSTLVEATHTVTFYAIDKRNNTNATQTVTLIVDRSAPAITIITGNGSKFARDNQSSAINTTVYETNYVVSVIFQVSNDSNPFNLTAVNVSGNWNLNINASTLPEGAHNITVFANDSLGNVNRSQLMTFVIDRTAPTISLSKSSSSTASTLVVDITASSDAQTCITDRGSVSGSGSSQTITASNLNPDTTYSFTVSCNDNVANLNTVTQSFRTDAGGSGPSGGGSSSGGGGGGSSSGNAAPTGTTESNEDSSPSETGSSNGGSGSGETSGESGDTQGTAAGQGSGSGDALAGQAFANGEGAIATFSRIFVNLSWLWIIIVIVVGAVVGYYAYSKADANRKR